MHRHRDPLHLVAAGLLIAATILFVVGTSLERSQAKAGGRQEAGAIERSQGESPEPNESEAAEGGSETTAEGTDQHSTEGESGEELFGVNAESAGLTAGVTAVSLLLAVLLIARPRRGLLVTVVAFGLVFAALDVREAIHQAGESNPGLVTIALVTGLLHLGVALVAAARLRSPRAAATTT